MLRQCLAGILAGMTLLFFGLLGSVVPADSLDSHETSAVQVEGTRLAENQMADIVAGKINWWAVAGTTLAVVGVTVACLSGVGLIGAAAALVTGAATTGEVVFAGTAFLAGMAAATGGSAICDSAGC